MKGESGEQFEGLAESDWTGELFDRGRGNDMVESG